MRMVLCSVLRSIIVRPSVKFFNNTNYSLITASVCPNGTFQRIIDNIFNHIFRWKRHLQQKLKYQYNVSYATSIMQVFSIKFHINSQVIIYSTPGIRSQLHRNHETGCKQKCAKTIDFELLFNVYVGSYDMDKDFRHLSVEENYHLARTWGNMDVRF